MSQNQKTFVCSACGQSFATIEERDRHNRDRHPEMARKAGQTT